MSKRRIKEFVDQVGSHLVCDQKTKHRIETDLHQHITQAAKNDEVEKIIQNMGDPKTVAKEFMDNLYDDKSEIIESLLNEQYKTHYEYTSKKKLWGIPLIHIKHNKRMGNSQLCVAKGIIAIGDLSIGIISLGGISFGLFSIGGASVGLIALGGLALGGIAIGGLAIGLLALGGVAIGVGAIGGYVIASHIGMGGHVQSHVAIGGKAIGEYVISGQEQGPSYSLSQVDATKAQVFDLIKNVYTNIPDWMAKIFTFFV